MKTVFVYGTLKTGQVNNGILSRLADKGAARKVGNATLRGSGNVLAYTLVAPLHGKGYPYLVPVNEEGYGRVSGMNGVDISGEVWEVNAEGLNVLDRLEGFPVHYRRDVVNVETANGVLACLVYVPSVECWEHILPHVKRGDFECVGGLWPKPSRVRPLVSSSLPRGGWSGEDTGRTF